MSTFPRVALLAAAWPVTPAPAAELSGERLYAERCARCHAADGSGTPKSPAPLAGDRSVGQLAEVIADTMPEDNPGSLDAAQAKAVAGYVHAAFYSPAARARLAPPRVALSRLTARQHENALADLIGSFRPAAAYDLPRLGPQLEPVRYARKDWEGAVYAPHTGEYEFTFAAPTDVRGRVWLNEFDRPLVDAWVRSGDATEVRGRAKLVGGRAYRLKVEAVKITKRPKDAKLKAPLDARPDEPPNAVVSWTPPGGVAEPLDRRVLIDAKVPVVYVTPVDLPPDDRSLGWDRGTSVSKAWDAAATDAAVAAADYVAAHADELAGTTPGAADRPAKLAAFGRAFAERAFRRPLAADQIAAYVDHPLASCPDPLDGLKRLVLGVLKSPRFLYRDVGGGPPAYAVAERLAMAVWDSLPDEALRREAAAGGLHDRGQIRGHAERMLADPRGRAKLARFFRTWLKVDPPPDLTKDAGRFPGFSPHVMADLRTSLDRFVDDVVWADESDFRRLVTDDGIHLNGRLAGFYAADLPADAGFTKVRLPAEPRAGVLTHPYLLAAFGYTRASSPIHRGVFVARSLLGVALRPPNEAFTPLAEDLHPGLSTRERVALQTKPAACVTCHGVINPLGFTLEAFDTVGRFRATDNGKPVDAGGGYRTRADEAVTFAGPRDLGRFVADSPEAHGAFVEQLFHHLAQQPVRAYGADLPEQLRAKFAADGCHIRRLAADIATLVALAPTGWSEPGVSPRATERVAPSGPQKPAVGPLHGGVEVLAPTGPPVR